MFNDSLHVNFCIIQMINYSIFVLNHELYIVVFYGKTYYCIVLFKFI